MGFGWWIAPHLLLLLDWNLISCADSVVTSNIEIVGIWNDAIWFQIGVTRQTKMGPSMRTVFSMDTLAQKTLPTARYWPF